MKFIKAYIVRQPLSQLGRTGDEGPRKRQEGAKRQGELSDRDPKSYFRR